MKVVVGRWDLVFGEKTKSVGINDGLKNEDVGYRG